MAQRNTIGRVATTIKDTPQAVTVTYHATDVFTLDRVNNTVTFDTGGWFTATTKTRMNQACNQYGVEIKVYSKDGDWYAKKGAVSYPFDGETLTLEL